MKCTLLIVVKAFFILTLIQHELTITVKMHTVSVMQDTFLHPPPEIFSHPMPHLDPSLNCVVHKCLMIIFHYLSHIQHYTSSKYLQQKT